MEFKINLKFLFIQTDTGFSFELHLNDSYGAVLLNEEEGGTNGGFRLSGMVNLQKNHVFNVFTFQVGELDADRADMAIGVSRILFKFNSIFCRL